MSSCLLNIALRTFETFSPARDEAYVPPQSGECDCGGAADTR
jgi:hypothetical protein